MVEKKDLGKIPGLDQIGGQSRSLSADIDTEDFTDMDGGIESGEDLDIDDIMLGDEVPRGVGAYDYAKVESQRKLVTVPVDRTNSEPQGSGPPKKKKAVSEQKESVNDSVKGIADAFDFIEDVESDSSEESGSVEDPVSLTESIQQYNLDFMSSPAFHLTSKPECKDRTPFILDDQSLDEIITVGSISESVMFVVSTKELVRRFPNILPESDSHGCYPVKRDSTMGRNLSKLFASYYQKKGILLNVLLHRKSDSHLEFQLTNSESFSVSVYPQPVLVEKDGERSVYVLFALLPEGSQEIPEPMLVETLILVNLWSLV